MVKYPDLAELSHRILFRNHTRRPGNITFAEAASWPQAGLNDLKSLEFAGIKEYDRDLIHTGSGGVGSFASILTIPCITV